VNVRDFPNAFTPNNDGRNDVFLKNYDLVVLNRWGQELYRGVDGWDGTFDGKKVSPGTYFYILTLDNITERQNVIKGTVLLIQD
jgi:gliding motility-associated-like protein